MSSFPHGLDVETTPTSEDNAMYVDHRTAISFQNERLRAARGLHRSSFRPGSPERTAPEPTQHTGPAWLQRFHAAWLATRAAFGA